MKKICSYSQQGRCWAVLAARGVQSWSGTQVVSRAAGNDPEAIAGSNSSGHYFLQMPDKNLPLIPFFSQKRIKTIHISEVARIVISENHRMACVGKDL